MELAQKQNEGEGLGRGELSLPGGVYGIRDRTFLSRAPDFPHPDHPFNSLVDGSPARRITPIEPLKEAGETRRATQVNWLAGRLIRT